MHVFVCLSMSRQTEAERQQLQFCSGLSNFWHLLQSDSARVDYLLFLPSDFKYK